jgi:predicted transcriptional regulator
VNTRPKFAKTLFYLLVVPVLIVLIPLVFSVALPFFGISVLNLPVVIVLVLYPIAFYLMWLLLKVPYSDTTVLDRITIPNAPEEIEEQLKTLSKNHLVNVDIILILGNSNKNLNQTEIVDQLHEMSVDLTATRIREILKVLEDKKLGLISSLKGTHERDYKLTNKGEWCYSAIKIVFPKRNIWFIIRHQLGIKKLPQFPETN